MFELFVIIILFGAMIYMAKLHADYVQSSKNVIRILQRRNETLEVALYREQTNSINLKLRLEIYKMLEETK